MSSLPSLLTSAEASSVTSVLVGMTGGFLKVIAWSGTHVSNARTRTRRIRRAIEDTSVCIRAQGPKSGEAVANNNIGRQVLAISVNEKGARPLLGNHARRDSQ